MAQSSYAYAMGRIRSIEGKMLSGAQLDRMIDAKAADDAMRVLAEAEYGLAVGDAEGFRDYEKVLDDEYAKLIKLIRELSPEPKLIDIFLLKNDYHNAKAFLKGEFSGNLDESILSQAGLISPQKLKAALLERKFSDIPRILAAGIEEAIESFNKASDPQAVDIVLDKAQFAEMLLEAETLGNAFLTGLVRRYIDIANIGAFVRVKAMGKAWEFLRDALLDGGYVGHDLFFRSLQDNLDNFIAAVQATAYSDLCEEGLKSYQATGSLTVFERKADDFITDYISKAKLMSAGMEIIVSYFVAKQSELKNVRVVMVGKKNGIPGEIIRERLRKAYV